MFTKLKTILKRKVIPHAQKQHKDTVRSNFLESLIQTKACNNQGTCNKK